MLDQSFSSDNFNRIFLKENRKGNFNKIYFTSEYIEKHQEFKATVNEKVALKRSKGSLTKEELKDYAERLKKINKEKEKIRFDIFQNLSQKILDNKFQFKIDYNSDKETFMVQKDAASYYAIKQLQFNLNKTFKVKQSDRNRIIKQIFQVISDGYPKVIIKTDIRAFYESIPQTKLFQIIENNTLLSPLSKKLIKKLFYVYEKTKDTTKIAPQIGIPRGIGLSAYLSELYMREVDKSIKLMDDLIYYARYVDDIITIFIPKTESTKGEYLKEIENIICLKNCLSLKDGTDGEPTKTFVIDLPNKNTYTKAFNFLGYSFKIKRKSNRLKDFQVILEISDNKLNKYKSRIKNAVDAYNVDSIYNEKEARNLLFSRLKFLTGNFHLNNNKRNVKSGIYYSNEMLSLNSIPFSSLKILDLELSKAIHLIKPPPKIGINKNNLIHHILRNYSFKKGFLEKEKHFYTFRLSPRETKFYFRKYGRATTKFEVIKSIWK